MLHKDLEFQDALYHYKFAAEKEHADAPERVEYLEGLLKCLEDSKSNRKALRHHDIRLRFDWHFMRRAVEIQGCILDFACDDFHADEELVFEAARQNSFAFQYASDGQSEDRVFTISQLRIQALGSPGHFVQGS